jgi:hypothetical protein
VISVKFAVVCASPVVLQKVDRSLFWTVAAMMIAIVWPAPVTLEGT